MTLASHAPLEFGGPSRELSIDGVTRAPDAKPPVVTYILTGARYFDTLKLPVVRGRAFTQRDARRGAEGRDCRPAACARGSFPDDDPIGRRIRLGAAAPFLTIVGVAQTVPQSGPPELVRPVVYAPLQGRRRAGGPGDHRRQWESLRGRARRSATRSGARSESAALRDRNARHRRRPRRAFLCGWSAPGSASSRSSR